MGAAMRDHALMTSGAVEILYNGVCPVCRAGACDLERRAAAAKAGVRFSLRAITPRK